MAPVLLGAFTAMAIVAAGYPYVVLILGGIILSVCSIISAPFGIAVLLGISALFSRSELFSFSLPFFGGGLKPTDLLLASIMGGWLARSALKLRFPKMPRLIIFVVFAFLAWAAIAALIGIANGAFYKHSLLELRPLLHFMLILPIASDFKRRDAERTLVIMMIISVAISTKGLYLYQQGIGDPALFSEGNIRVTSIEFLYLVTSALTAIELFLRRKGPAPVLLGIFFLNCAALAVTFQRAAWLALLISVIFLIIAHRELRKGFLLAGILTISGLAAITASNFSTARNSSNPCRAGCLRYQATNRMCRPCTG